MNPGQVLQGSLPKPAAWAAGLGMKATTRVRGWMDDGLTLAVRPVDRFDERHDWLWTEVSADLQCAVVRDASYLNWKVRGPAGADVHAVRQMIHGGRVAGAAIWMVRPPDGVYRYGRAFLVDFVAPLSDAARLQQIRNQGRVPRSRG